MPWKHQKVIKYLEMLQLISRYQVEKEALRNLANSLESKAKIQAMKAKKVDLLRSLLDQIKEHETDLFHSGE